MRLSSPFKDGDFVEYRDEIYRVKIAGITRSVIEGNGKRLTVSHKQLTLWGKQNRLPVEEE